MWGIKKAQSVMGELMNYVTLCIANDEDFESSLGIHAYDGDISKGIDQIDSYKAGMKRSRAVIRAVRQLPVFFAICIQQKTVTGWGFI